MATIESWKNDVTVRLNELYNSYLSATDAVERSVQRLQWDGVDRIPAVSISNDTGDIDALASRIEAYAGRAITAIDNMSPPVVLPSAPTAPTLTAPAPVSAPVLADMPTAPSLTLPSMPTAPTVVVPDMPSLDMPLAPTAPTIGSVDAPTRIDLALPSAPTITLPEFTDEFTPAAIHQFSVTYDWVAEREDLDDTRYGRFMDYLQQLINSSPLPGTEEQELYQRARNRVESQFADSRRQIASRFAMLNYPSPPGALLVALQRHDEELNREMTNINAEIQREALQTRVKWRETVLGHMARAEELSVQWLNDVRNRLLQSLKDKVAAEAQRVASEAEQARYQLDAFKTRAEVFVQRLRAAEMEVNVYRGQLEASRLRGELNANEVQLYTAMLGAQRVAVEVYSASVNAYEARSRVEMLKLQQYTAMLEGKRAAVDVFRAQVDGAKAVADIEQTKQQIFSSQVQAQVSANSVQIEKYRAELAAANFHIEQQRLLLEQYRAQVATYQINADVANTSANMAVERARSVVAAATAAADSLGTAAGAVGEAMRTRMNAESTRAELAMRGWEATTKGKMMIAETSITAARDRADAALNSMGALSSLVSGIVIEQVS